MDYSLALRFAQKLKKCMKKKGSVMLVGSLCRYKSAVQHKKITINKIPKIKDIDLLVIVPNKSDLEQEISFNGLTYRTPNKTPGRRRFYINGIKIDIFLTTTKEKPYAVLHFTSSKMYNIRLRHHTKSKLGLKLNQHGLFDIKTGKKINIRPKNDLDILRYLKVTARPIWDRMK